jgi:predicted amidohydrolase
MQVVRYIITFDSMKVSIVQINIKSKDIEANLGRIEELTKSNDSDLVVLPEMFNTGYFANDETLAESMEGKTLAWMQRVTKANKNAMCGSLLISEEDQIFNRFVMVSNGDVVGHYDKTHLFGMANEQENITAGNVKADMVVNGFKIRPIICYDLRFPYTSFNDSEYDVLLNVASWPSQRIAHWDALLQARAIENQAYVIGCNRVGEQVLADDKIFYYPGHSSAYAPNGEQLAHSVKEEVVTVSLDKSVIEYTRNLLPFLKDRRM